MSSTSFGLHVGNSVSCLSVHKDLRVEVVANDAGERVTPAAVVFAGNAEVLTGLSAKQFLARFPRSGVKYGNKRAMGECGGGGSKRAKRKAQKGVWVWSAINAGND
jgi:molecular chaperone DnaK (HSP70)